MLLKDDLAKIIETILSRNKTPMIQQPMIHQPILGKGMEPITELQAMELLKGKGYHFY